VISGAVALTLAILAQSGTPVATAVSAQATAPPTHTEVHDQPFRDLLKNLAHDVRALPSANNALVTSIGVGTAVVVSPTDDNIAGWVQKRDDAGYTKIGDLGGNGYTQVGGALGVYAVGVITDAARVTHLGSDLIRGHLLTGIFTQALKVSVNRERPNGGRHSFPSGHTSASFLTAAVVEANFGWKAGAAAYAGAGFVAWTRIRDNRHWLTDGVIAATIGTVVGRTVTRDHHGSAKPWTIVPSASSHGAAIFIVRRPPA
jgi:membrane-associated phospholipid phosphatase